MTRDELVASLQEQGLEPKAYSGRAMYGAECVGASVNHPGDHALPPGWRQDALGKHFIVYWPSVPWRDTDVA